MQKVFWFLCYAKSVFVGKIDEQNFPSINNRQLTLFTRKQLKSSHDSQKLINHVNKMIMRSHTVTPHCPVNRKHRWNDFGISRALQKWNSKWCSRTSLFFFFLFFFNLWACLLHGRCGQALLSFWHYLEVIPKWMSELIEAKIVQKKTSTSGANELSHK